MTCTCGQPTEGLLCRECTEASRRALRPECYAEGAMPAVPTCDLESDAMPPGAEGAD